MDLGLEEGLCHIPLQHFKEVSGQIFRKQDSMDRNC